MRRYELWSVRAEASLYPILHKYGGVWAAMDVRPLQPLDAFLAGYEQGGARVIVGEDPIRNVDMTVIAAAKRDPFMAYCVNGAELLTRVGRGARWFL